MSSFPFDRYRSDFKLSARLAVVLAYAAVLIFGCGVVRVPTRTADPSGNPQTIDLRFLKAGSTTRAEVSLNLQGIDSHVNEHGFFWGRWASSSVLYGTGVRGWGDHNILVEFDPQGIVKGWMVTDDRGLSTNLDQLTAGDPPLNLSHPIHAHVELSYSQINEGKSAVSGDIVLMGRYLECTATTLSPALAESSGCTGSRIPRNNIIGIAYSSIADVRPDPFIRATIHVGGSKHRLKVAVDPPTLLVLHRYIRQTQ